MRDGLVNVVKDEESRMLVFEEMLLTCIVAVRMRAGLSTNRLQCAAIEVVSRGVGARQALRNVLTGGFN